MRNAWRFHKLSGISLPAMAQGGPGDAQVARPHLDADDDGGQHADAPKAALVDGKVESGVMASGQVVGVIDDLPTCKELIDRIVAEADEDPGEPGGKQCLSRGCSTASTA